MKKRSEFKSSGELIETSLGSVGKLLGDEFIVGNPSSSIEMDIFVRSYYHGDK